MYSTNILKFLKSSGIDQVSTNIDNEIAELGNVFNYNQFVTLCDAKGEYCNSWIALCIYCNYIISTKTIIPNQIIYPIVLDDLQKVEDCNFTLGDVKDILRIVTEINLIISGIELPADLHFKLDHSDKMMVEMFNFIVVNNGWLKRISTLPLRYFDSYQKFLETMMDEEKFRELYSSLDISNRKKEFLNNLEKVAKDSDDE